MSTPGIVIDNKVVHAGGVPDRKSIESWFSDDANTQTGDLDCCGGKCC